MPQHANFKFRPCYKTNLANTCFACLSELSSSCLHKSRLHIPNAVNSDPTIQAIWHDKVHTEYTVKQLTQQWQWVNGLQVMDLMGHQFQIGHISHGSGLVTHWPDIQKRLCMHFFAFSGQPGGMRCYSCQSEVDVALQSHEMNEISTTLVHSLLLQAWLYQLFVAN